MKEERIMNKQKIYLFLFALIAMLMMTNMKTKAQFGGGNGSYETPYLIRTVAHLQELATNVNNGNRYRGQVFKLDPTNGTNIDLSGVSWIPIGVRMNSTTYGYFEGLFDGNNKSITNLNSIASTAYTYNTAIGLFGSISAGGVKNLTITTTGISTSPVSSFGLLAASVGAAVIYNCKVKPQGSTATANVSFLTTTSSYVQAGALIGNVGEGVSILGCGSEINLSISGSANYARIGGLIGYINDYSSLELRCSYATGNVSNTSTQLGYLWIAGFVGEFSLGTTRNSSDFGIFDCYSRGNVTSVANSNYTYLGGFIGELSFGRSSSDSNYNALTNCFSSGVASYSGSRGSFNKLGGFIGDQDYPNNTVSGCYFNNSSTTYSVGDPASTNITGASGTTSFTGLFPGYSSSIWQAGTPTISLKTYTPSVTQITKTSPTESYIIVNPGETPYKRVDFTILQTPYYMGAVDYFDDPTIAAGGIRSDYDVPGEIPTKKMVGFTVKTTDQNKITIVSGYDYSKRISVIINPHYNWSYNANGGTGTMTSSSIRQTDSYTVLDNTFTPPANKRFKNWNTKADGTGTAYAAGQAYATGAADITLYAIWESVVTVNLKLFLQGMTQSVGTMTNYAQVPNPNYCGYSAPCLPLNPPAVYGINDVNCPNINNVTLAGNIVDWVKVEVIRVGTNNKLTILEQQALLLKTNGDVVDINGKAPVFNPQNGTVRLVIKHQNHLGVMTTDITNFGQTVFTYNCNLSTTPSLAFKYDSQDPAPMVQKNGVWCLWAGDLNMDGSIDNDDSNLIFIRSLDESLYGKYIPTDVNMDGSIDNEDMNNINTNFYVGIYSPLIFFTY